MRKLFALLVLGGIVASCSTDPVITNTTNINHNIYYGKVQDSVGIIVTFPTIIDTIG